MKITHDWLTAITSDAGITLVNKKYERWEIDFITEHNLTRNAYDMLVIWADKKMKIKKVTARAMTNIVYEYNSKALFSGEWTNGIQYDGEYSGK